MEAFHKLKVESPYEILEIEDIKISNNPNEHGRLYLKALLDDSINFKYAIEASTDDKISIYEETEDKEKSIIFNGTIQNIRTENINGIYYMEIEAYTSSFELDIKEKSRSFQDAEMSYDDLIKTILLDYKIYSFTQRMDKPMSIGRPLFQYKETDYEFLKRVASQIGLEINCDIINTNNVFYFGRPWGKEYKIEDNIDYEALKDIKKYRKSLVHNPNFHDTDFFYYKIRTRKVMELGAQVVFKQKKFYINSYEAEYVRGELIYTYKLCRERGIWQEKLYNDKIKGISLEGEVLEVSGEKVKLHLDIDETQNKDKAAWFRYAPPTGNLMYSMPIVGTNANLYFSSERSEDPIVIGCIRKNGSSCESFSDVNNRYFATESGNNLDMLPGAINFSRPGLSANFNDGSGINLSSSSSLNISAGYVGIYAGDITIKAKSKLEAKKGESSFISLENDFYNNAGIVMENGSDKASNGAFDDDPQKGAAEAKKAKAAMESAVKVALAAVVGAVQGAMGKIGECLAGVVENQKGNVESQTNSNKSGEKSLLDSNNISDPLNLYSNKPWRNVDSNIKLPDNECYIEPANENALPIVSDELTMTEYDPYMKDFKDGMYVQNRAPDNRYYLGTITYNSDLNMAIYKPTDKKGFEQAKLEQDKKDIRTIASFVADWTPADVAIDSASFIAGHDIITGEDCNRGILAAGILLPGGLDSLGKGLAKKGVKQASKHGDDVAEEAFKIGDDVYDATKGVADPKLFKVSDSALNHSSVGDFTYNPKTGKVSKMKGGGHGQANIDFLDANGLKYEVVDTYPNGVRVGNVADHKVKVKRTGSNQSWFPESWTESDIVSAGEYVGNLKGNINAVDGVISYGEVNGVRVGVIRTNGQISTVFPDATIQP